jgi:hypothetical protein
MSAPWTVRGRELVLNGFQDLPNILIVSSLLLGGITGSMPLIILGLGALGSSAFYLIIQNSLSMFALNWFKVPYSSACVSHKGYYDVKYRTSFDGLPSTWLFTLSYFVGYLLWNAVTIISLNPTTKNDVDKINSRRAQGISVLIAILIMYLVFVIYRIRSNCETIISGFAGTILGLVTGIGIFISIMNTDLRIGDVLQIRQGMEPVTTLQNQAAPIVCTPPSE